MSLIWNCGRRMLCRNRLPLLMGILNVTPDSFSDGGRHATTDTAVEHGLRLAADGADIIDVGGESTRPGSLPAALEEELARTLPVIERLVPRVAVPISIDTTKAEVARRAMAAGATIVNDISGLTFDPDMLEVCRNTDAGICLMHIHGTPQNMQDDPQYADVVAEVVQFLQDQLQRCVETGISASRICLDPGIGFGKTAEHNLRLLRAVPDIRSQLRRPLLIGHSRKRFLSKILGRAVEERLAGTIGVSIALAELGADVLRVHDVCAVRDALVAWSALSDP